MYDFIEGKVVSVTSYSVVIDAGGIGYRLMIPHHLCSAQDQGTVRMFYVSFIIRENSQVLYGFTTGQDRDFFELLITLSGIGPKLALQIMSYTPVGKFTTWVMEKNTAALMQIPGIGKKTAEKMLLELQDKLDRLPTPISSSPITEDAKKALVALGLSPKVAEARITALQGSLSQCDVETLVTMALREKG